jgi:hypothetical protein
MTKKPSKPIRMAPLQKLAVKPIEDPAEQEALDETLKRSEGAASSVPTGGRAPSRPTPRAVLELCHQLTAEGSLLVATELMAQLPVEQRRELVERWTAQIPPEATRRVEEGLRGRAGGRSDDANNAGSNKNE